MSTSKKSGVGCEHFKYKPVRKMFVYICGNCRKVLPTLEVISKYADMDFNK